MALGAGGVEPRPYGGREDLCKPGVGRTESSAPTDSLVAGTAGRCGERTERCQWQMKRSERVAAVKILSVRRKAAQKFWAPQQDHRPLRKHYKGCNGRATARVAPTELYHGGRWGGNVMKGDFYERRYEEGLSAQGQEE